MNPYDRMLAEKQMNPYDRMLAELETIRSRELSLASELQQHMQEIVTLLRDLNAQSPDEDR